VRAYLRAGWPVQAVQRQGHLQDLLTTYVNATAGALGGLSQAIINGFNLFALLLTALLVSPGAALGAALAALAIGGGRRPLRARIRRRSRLASRANLEFATGVTELTSALQEVRIFGVQDELESRLAVLNRNHASLATRVALAVGMVGLAYQAVAMFLLIGALA